MLIANEYCSTNGLKWFCLFLSMFPCKSIDYKMAGFKYTLGINELSSRKHKLSNALLAEFVGKWSNLDQNHLITWSLANDPYPTIICVYLENPTGIFLLNYFACATCTFGNQTMMSFAFGLTVFVSIMVSFISTNHYFFLSTVCCGFVWVFVVTVSPFHRNTHIKGIKASANLWKQLHPFWVTLNWLSPIWYVFPLRECIW